MAGSISLPRISPTGVDQPEPAVLRPFTHLVQEAKAAARAAVFFLKVFPMLPSQPVDWLTRPPVIEPVRYPTRTGFAEGEVYCPSTAGPHPAMVVCLGVVPFGVDHPQVAVLGKALARAGFAALLYWSPAMRDLRLDPRDVEDIALAYDWFIGQPYIDPARSGLLGTCVGGTFAMLAAAHPLIRERVAFLSAYAPFSSMWTFARDIASATRCNGMEREPWAVDPLTRKVFVHSLTDTLEEDEARWMRSLFAPEGDATGTAPQQPDAFTEEGGPCVEGKLSAEARAVYDLLTARGPDAAEATLHRLPAAMQQRLNDLSLLNTLENLHAPLISLLHDAGDQVIPVGETRRLVSALAGRAGVDYTEMKFQHLDPIKGNLPFFKLLGELGKFFRAVHPLFRQVAAV